MNTPVIKNTTTVLGVISCYNPNKPVALASDQPCEGKAALTLRQKQRRVPVTYKTVGSWEDAQPHATLNKTTAPFSLRKTCY